ncbi:MAG: ATP-grasp domain-containing protein [bacterium]|nr:ATP-grasp domain-containing protein [bacterium]
MIKTKLRTKSAQLIFKAALDKGLKVKVISNRFNLMELFFHGKSIFVKGTSFPINSQPACFIANNKFLTKKILRSHNIPIPKSWLVRTPAEARNLILKKKLFPCVLKPIKGAHGNKVYANIESLKEFEELLPFVFTRPGPEDVLVEEFVHGKDYRFLVVGDKVSAVIQRMPARIIGDGKRNIRQLIKAFNQNPLVGKKYEKPMCRIKINGEIKRNLKKQNKKLTYIPAKGQKIILRQNANISTGGISLDVTDKINGSLNQTAVKAAGAIGMKIAGVDIIYNASSQKHWVLELNDCPGIDIHHHPVFGKSRDVAGDIIAFLLQN